MHSALGYADDVAIIEYGNEVRVSRVSDRVTAIAQGSKTSADMDVNVSKTKSLHVRRQARRSQQDHRGRSPRQMPNVSSNALTQDLQDVPDKKGYGYTCRKMSVEE